METQELKTNLNQFIGTEKYHKLGITRTLFTDGMAFLANEAGAFWLCDMIASHLYTNDQTTPKKLPTGESWPTEPFTSFKVTIKGNKGVFKMEDGNKGVLARQDIPYTDFPLETFQAYGSWNGDAWVVMLTSEY